MGCVTSGPPPVMWSAFSDADAVPLHDGRRASAARAQLGRPDVAAPRSPRGSREPPRTGPRRLCSFLGRRGARGCHANDGVSLLLEDGFQLCRGLGSAGASALPRLHLCPWGPGGPPGQSCARLCLVTQCSQGSRVPLGSRTRQQGMKPSEDTEQTWP